MSRANERPPRDRVGRGNELPAGKLPGALLQELLAGLREAGAPGDTDVLLGPALGEDAAALRVPEGVLVVASDPVTLTGSDVGRFAVVINANDVAVTGATPRWFLAAVLLPPGTTEDAVAEVFAGLAAAAREAGVAVVGGHTEVTPAVAQPLVVGQMLGLTVDERPLSTGGASPGDVLVQVGAVPVEGAAVLAAEAAERLRELDVRDPEVVAAARGAGEDPGISVVDPALAAAELGATAMHDPTEGGLRSGLHELAAASGVALRVDVDRVAWFGPGVAVCEALGADPSATLASGALLATFPDGRARAAVDSLQDRGWPVAELGRVEEGSGVADVRGDALPWPERDEVARVLAAPPDTAPPDTAFP